jgi:hypothetical protein
VEALGPGESWSKSPVKSKSNRRFQYGGFWFSAVDPWPEYWTANWYDNDDVHITYADDGYYLYSRRYPQDRIAIAVYAN